MLQFTRNHLNTIIAHAKESAPEECCGLVGGNSAGQAQTIYRLRNTAADRQVAYEAAPEELFAAQRQMREQGEQLIAIYHSHPRAISPSPSDTDVRLAYYPNAIYLIVSLGGDDPIIMAFRISEREQRWQQVEYAIVDE